MRILLILFQFVCVLLLQKIQIATSHRVYRRLKSTDDGLDNDNAPNPDPIPPPPSSSSLIITSTIPPTEHTPTAYYTNPPESLILPPSLESTSGGLNSNTIGNDSSKSSNYVGEFMNGSSTFYIRLGGAFVILALLMLVWRLLCRLRSSSSSSSSSSSPLRDKTQYSRIPQSDGDIEFGLKSSTANTGYPVVHAADDDDDDEGGDWEEWETKNSKNLISSSIKSTLPGPTTTTVHSSNKSSTNNSNNDLRASSQSTPTKLSPIASEASLKSQSYDNLPTPPPVYSSTSSAPSSKTKKSASTPPVPADVDLFAVSLYIYY